MNKFDTIQLVKKLGLNTEDSILLTHQTETRLMFRFLQELDEVSIRTTLPNEVHGDTMHFPIINVGQAVPVIGEILNKGLYAIVAKPIDPADCELAGAAYKQDDNVTLEMAKGPCTTRKVTTDHIIDYVMLYNFGWYENPRQEHDEHIMNLMRNMIKQVLTIPLTTCVVEMSYYKIPVGYRHENIIIWEITSDGTKDSDMALARLLRSGK